MKSIYEQVRRRGRGPAEPKANWSLGKGCRVVETSASLTVAGHRCNNFLHPLCAAVNNLCPLVTHLTEHGRFPQSLSQGKPHLRVLGSTEGMKGAQVHPGQGQELALEW